MPLPAWCQPWFLTHASGMGCGIIQQLCSGLALFVFVLQVEVWTGSFFPTGRYPQGEKLNYKELGGSCSIVQSVGSSSPLETG